MKKILIALLSLLSVGCLALGVSACGENVEDSSPSANNQPWTLETVYAKAQELGFDGSLEEFLSTVTGKDGKNGVDGKDGVGIKNIYLNQNSEMIIELSDGTVKNLGAFASSPSLLPSYSENLAYIISEDKSYYSLRGLGLCADRDIIIPSTYRGLPVKEISQSAFQGGELINSITIPSSITCINPAFSGCYNLSSVYYQGTLEEWCSIQFNSGDGYQYHLLQRAENLYINNTLISGDLVFPDSITSIPDYAFYGYAALTSLTVGDSLTTIGENAFYSCDALTSVTLGNSVTTIGNSAFYSCDALTSIYYTGDIASWCAISGLSFLPKNDLYIDNKKIEGTLTIPNSVTIIGNSAFSNCYALTSVTIPDSVTTIGEWAFSGCNALTSVTLGNSVTTVGDYTFSNCDALTSIYYTGDIASWCAISGLSFLPKNDLYIDNKKIEGTLTIPNSVTTIGEWAFENCDALTSVTIPDSVTTIGYAAFENCDALTSVTLGNSVTTIGEEAFSGCYALTSVTIPDSVTTVGEEAFSNCYALTSVTIPDSVTTIGYAAFYYCRALTSVIFETPTGWTDSNGNTVDFSEAEYTAEFLKYRSNSSYTRS